MNVREIMTKDPAKLAETDNVRTAAKLMRDQHIGTVLVTRGDGSLCGIVTDRDLAVRSLASDTPDPGHMRLGELCTTEIQHLSPDTDVDEAIKMMGRSKVRRLPVVENGKPIGIVSIGDLAERRDPSSLLGQISGAPANN